MEINAEEAKRFLSSLDIAFDEGLEEPEDKEIIAKLIREYPVLKSETVINR